MEEVKELSFSYRRILVPLDGSELAEMAMTTAVELARFMKAEIHCLQVVTGLTLNLDPTLNQRIVTAREYAADLYLQSLRDRFAESGVDINSSTTSGSAAKSIIDYTKNEGIDLIVMSSHGQSALSRWVYGNVAIKILRHAPCDTLMIRPFGTAESLPKKRVMVPLDGSPPSERALKPALELASIWELDIMLLWVSPPIFTDQDPIDSHDFFDDIEEKLNEEAMAYLLDIQSSQAGKSLSIDVETASGPEAATIIDTANANEVDLIVMSSHGRSGPGLWLMGSVSEKVLRKATCSTLIVRNA